MAYTKSRPYSWLEARRLKFLPSQSVDGVQEDKLESKDEGVQEDKLVSKDEEENKFFPIPNNKQLVKTKKQTESFIKDFDIPSMFETFDPSNSSKIITSEDLIKATEFRNSPLARFGPTVLGQLNPVFGILGRIGTFLIDRKIENVLNLRGDEDLLKQWKKGERKEVIESLTEKARVAEEAVKPVDVPVDIDAGQFEGGDTGVGATAISPQEAAAVAVAGGQNIDTSGQGTTPQPTTPTPEAPDIPDIEVPDTDQGAADVAASEAGISIFDFKKGGQVRQPMAVGSLVKAGSKVLTKLQKKQPMKEQMKALTPAPQAEPLPITTQPDPLFKLEEPIEPVSETIDIGKPVEVDESVTADKAIGVEAKEILSGDFKSKFKDKSDKEFSDLGIEPYTDKPNPDMQESIKKVLNKEKSVDGSTYKLEDHKQFVENTKPITRWKTIPIITMPRDIVKALRAGKLFTKQGEVKPKAGVYGLNKKIPDGTELETRLDIPSYLDFNKWIAVLTRVGESKDTTYSPTAYLTNVTFKHGETQAKRVGTGAGTKGAFGTIKGNWKNHNSETLAEEAKKLLDNSEWVQIGYDPRRHSVFYTREEFKVGDKVYSKATAIESADEVIQIGPLVLAKGPKFRDTKQQYKKGGQVQDLRDGGRVRSR